MIHKHTFYAKQLKRNLAEEANEVLSRFSNEMNPAMRIDVELAEFMEKEYSLLVVPMGIVRKIVFSDAGMGLVRAHSEAVK